MTSPALPTFVMIGTEGPATGWLRHQLGEHPDLHMSPVELGFFTGAWSRGMDWYRHQVAAPTTVSIIGDYAPDCLLWPNDPGVVAARIDGALPDVRVVAVLRDPVERLVSAYVDHAHGGRISAGQPLMSELADRDPERDALALISGGWYGRSLHPYRRRFAERLLVLTDEDVHSTPSRALERVCLHLGATPTEVSVPPPSVDEVSTDDVPPAIVEAAALTAAERHEIWSRWFSEDMKALQRHTAVDVTPWEARYTAAR